MGNRFLLAKKKSQKRKHLHTASARQEVKDSEVGDRELQATTDSKKGSPTTVRMIQVDAGRLRAARIGWGANNGVRQI